LIRAESARQIVESTTVYVMLVVPLLIESGAYRETMARILVVDCEQETQIRRVMDRSALSREEVVSIIASQASRQSRLDLADDVIHNDGDLGALQTQVFALHRRYVDLAKNGRLL
jgi:dephospho-CoA kinase